MSKQTYTTTFTWAENENTGIHGWLPDWAPGYDPSSDSIGVYHDAFEHLDPNPTLDGEMRAFGAIIGMRYIGGYDPWEVQAASYRRYVDPHNWHNGLSTDLADFLRDLVMSDGCAPRIAEIMPARARPIPRLEDAEVDDVINELVASARSQFLSLLAEDTEIDETTGVSPGEDGFLGCGISFRKYWHELAENCRQHMRHGYLQMGGRWDQNYSHASACAYALQQKVKEVTPRGGDEYDGLILRVSYSPRDYQHPQVRLLNGHIYDM